MKKYYCIKQHDITDCGAACLATICKQNGYKTGITKIREVVVTDKQSDMELLTLNEIQMINGGKLETVSDWLLLGGSICVCFAAPQVGVPMTIAVAVWA